MAQLEDYCICVWTDLRSQPELLGNAGAEAFDEPILQPKITSNLSQKTSRKSRATAEELVY